MHTYMHAYIYIYDVQTMRTCFVVRRALLTRWAPFFPMQAASCGRALRDGAESEDAEMPGARPIQSRGFSSGLVGKWFNGLGYKGLRESQNGRGVPVEANWFCWPLVDFVSTKRWGVKLLEPTSGRD